jgi:ATP-binding cassette subfamily F protein uup
MLDDELESDMRTVLRIVGAGRAARNGAAIKNRQPQSKLYVKNAPEKLENISSKKKAGYKEKREFELLENEIAALENEKKSIETELATANLNYESLLRNSARIGEISTLLNAKEMRWLQLSEIME